jgi:hypothetical protein
MSEKKALSKQCQEVDCEESAQVNGYCRLHFLKLVKNEGAKKPKRRAPLRPETATEVDPELVTSQVGHYSQIDNDLTTLVEVSELDAPPKKTGS